MTADDLDLDALVLAIKQVAGDHLKRIVLTSYTDVAVLLQGFDPENTVDTEATQHIFTRILGLKGNKAFGSLASRLMFHVGAAEEAASLSGGRVLWSRQSQ